MLFGTFSPGPLGPPKHLLSTQQPLFRHASNIQGRLHQPCATCNRPHAAAPVSAQPATMFALRKIPAMVGHRAGSLQMLAPRQTAMYASRSRSALFCAAQAKATGAKAGA